MKSVNIKLSNLYVNEGQIEGLPANPRFIRDEKFQKLKQSLIDDPEMLDIRELVVYPHPTMTGKYIIIGGNMRYNAAKELGMTELPCKILPNDTPVEKMRAYTIKDNVGYGEWDMDLLANEWETDELQDWGVDLPTYLDAEEIINDKSATSLSEKNNTELRIPLDTDTYARVIEALQSFDDDMSKAIVMALGL